MLDHPRRGEFDLSTLRTGIMAGATCPIEVMRRVIGEMHMGEVQIAYGMTETSPVSLQTGADDDLERRVTTVGRTQPQLESKIIDLGGQHRRARRDRRAVYPWLQRDARLLEQPRRHPRGHRRRRLDAHRRPGDAWTSTATCALSGATRT